MEAKANGRRSEGKPKIFTISIDGEEYEVEEKDQTVAELLELGGEDPSMTYLVELKGTEQIEHKDVGEVLKLHNKMRFVTADRGPAPVA